MVSLTGVEGKNFGCHECDAVSFKGQGRHSTICSAQAQDTLPVSCQSRQVSLFKACSMNIRHSYLISSLPTVSAEDKENDM